MRHETNITKIPFDQLREVFSDRALTRAQEQFRPTEESQFFQGLRDPAREQAVESLLAGHYAEGGDSDGAWEAHCTCGWAANNPVPTEAHAQEAADAHLFAIYGE
jgi:hypothetical protein